MLEKEIEIFEEKLDSLLKSNSGEFVLIKNEEISIFLNEEKAIKEGLIKYGATSNFLVRKITPKQPKIEMPAFSLGLLNAHI